MSQKKDTQLDKPTEDWSQSVDAADDENPVHRDLIADPVPQPDASGVTLDTPNLVTVNTNPVPFKPFLDDLIAKHSADTENLIDPNHFKAAIEAAVHAATKPVIPGGFIESSQEIGAMIQAARIDYGGLHHANKRQE